MLRSLVVDTSNWWVGKKVLVAPQWASGVSWEEKKVYVAMSREALKESPEWNASGAVNREYEARLYDYYGRPVYWEGGDRTAGVSPQHETNNQIEETTTMPNKNGTGPRHDGSGAGNGGGGRGGPGGGGGGGRGLGGVGAGPTGTCTCTSCGHQEPHQQGKPCKVETCSKCGAAMART